ICLFVFFFQAEDGIRDRNVTGVQTCALRSRNDEIFDFCKRLGVTYYPVIIGKDEFQDAPTSKRYPETIYYRLLAHEYLPQDLDKVLYIDADILCLNDISTIYEMKLDNFLYAAASHIADSNIRDLINKARLGNF